MKSSMKVAAPPLMLVRSDPASLRRRLNPSPLLNPVCAPLGPLRLTANPWRFGNSIIRASIEKGSPPKALLHFRTVLLSGAFRPDHRTFALVLRACGASHDVDSAMMTHARIVKSGLGSDDPIARALFTLYLNDGCIVYARKLFDAMWVGDPDPFCANLLIYAYLKAGEFDRANMVFTKMPVRDLVSWNTMIAGCVRSFRPQEGICFFQRMLQTGFKPDGFSFSTVLSACAQSGARSRGEWVHHLMVDEEVEMNDILNAALIDMYAKCGSIEMARNIFDDISRKAVSIWNSMISALAIHGFGLDATQFFERMEREGTIPDQITFVGLLTACSHCGLAEKGCHFFYLMQNKYSIKPLIEHYGAMVDLLARAGHLQEAYDTVKAMPMEPDVVVWRALLSACRTYQQAKFGEIAIREIENHQSGDYALLSNIYALANRWECAENVWVKMKSKKIKKDRGLSWLELSGTIYKFKAGDRSHTESKKIYQVLDELLKRAKVNGFVPVTRLVSVDVLEEEKEENISCHSEKLAVSYAILRTEPLSDIRVSKNLRTCADCHSWLKLVSRMIGRVIIVRDRIRFHRFESGLCSCGDYW